MNVVILAAGAGKRMRSQLPKVLHPLAGRPLLAHVLATARAIGADRICVVYGHGGESVPTAMGAADVTWVRQEPQLGTGHALLQALPHLEADATTLVLYGDVPLTRVATLQALLAQADGDSLALLSVVLDNPTGYGRIVRGQEGTILRIVEEKDASDNERAIHEVNSGILAAPTARLAEWLPSLGRGNAQGEYYLTDIVGLAVAAGIKVSASQPQDVWETSGVNDRAQLATLERIFQRGVASRLMESGVHLADPARIDVRGELDCGMDVAIDIDCIFEGRVELGAGVVVGAHCLLADCRVGAGTRIAAFSHLVSADIDRDCHIGPYARLRPGTSLGPGVHVGNFVEVKNSRIAAQSKANHLAYIGDATVGERVNIGAGTITCNYDGANKHRTIIGDDVFIGSDTQLVAPVVVGRGATLGAGTTLTKDAPADTLTVSRAKQVSVPGWKRPKKGS